MEQRDKIIEAMKKTVVGYENGHKVLAETIWLPRVFNAMADTILGMGAIFPPVGIKQKLWCLWMKNVEECKVSGITQKADGSLKIRITHLNSGNVFEIKELGENVFIEKEQAEKKLEELEWLKTNG